MFESLGVGYLVYLVTSISSISTAIFVITTLILAIIGFIIFMEVVVDEREDSNLVKYSKLIMKKVVPVMIISVVAKTVLPSKDDLKYIIGGATIYGITQVDGVEKLPKNVVDAMNKFLEDLKEDK